MNDTHKWYLPEESRITIKEHFKNLKKPVTIELFTDAGEENEYTEISKAFLKDLPIIDEKIKLLSFYLTDDRAKEMQVHTSPTLLIQPDSYNIRFNGAPIGEEGKSLLTSLIMASNNDPDLQEESKTFLNKIDEKKHIQVFVTPTCPYCPGQVLNAFRAAMYKPEVISAECVEAQENMELAQKLQVGAVPHTVVNGELFGKGLMPEEKFMAILSGEEVADFSEESEETDSDKNIEQFDLVVVGGGPAGLTASIYGERSGLKTLLLEKSVLGGQVATTPIVENYTGFRSIGGKSLIEMMSVHAREYADIREGVNVKEIKVGKQIEVITDRHHFAAKGLIIATGAKHKMLGIPGEQKFFGNGVNYCATCDGYLFKGKKVYVIGGGNTALTDALYLKNLGVDVTLIHRRHEFRAEKHLVETVKNENIPILWDSVLEEVSGGNKVEKIRVRNIRENHTNVLETDGIFVAIGWAPNNDLAQEVGLKLDDYGYIITDKMCRTSIPRIYAAGDVSGGIQQIVNATSDGATAAMAAFEDIQNPYWKK